MKFTPVMLLSCTTKLYSFVHDKSSPTSLFIKGKSRDLLKMLRYLSGIVTCTFKNDTDGCPGWSVCPEFWSCGNLSHLSAVLH